MQLKTAQVQCNNTNILFLTIIAEEEPLSDVRVIAATGSSIHLSMKKQRCVEKYVVTFYVKLEQSQNLYCSHTGPNSSNAFGKPG